MYIKSNNYGVSETVGVILLLGMTVFMIGLLASQGSYMIQSLEDQSQEKSLENHFTLMAGQQSTVGYSDGGRQYFSLQNAENTMNTVKTRITVREYNNNSSGPIIYNETITGLSYNTSESQYLIISGGVFRHSRNTNDTEIITHPSFDFTESTVTLPIIDIHTSEESIQNNKKYTFKYNNSSTTSSNYVESNQVSVNVSGSGYKGWGKSIKLLSDTEVNYNDEENTSQAIFGVSDIVIDSTDKTITSTNSVTVTGGATINGDVSSPNVDGKNNINGDISSTTTEHPPLDSYIRGVVKDSKNNATNTSITNGDTLKSGYYYVDEDVSLDDGVTTFDAENGNVTIVVDGDMYIKNDAKINIVNTTDNQTVSFIISGEEYMVHEGSPEVVVENKTTGHHIVYGSSNLDAKITQSASWDGIFYAPRKVSNTVGDPKRGNGKGGNGKGGNGGGANCKKSDVSVCMGASSEINGAIIAGNMKLGQSATLSYDSNLEDYSLPQKPVKNTQRVEITYLHISEFTVNLKEYK